MALYRDQDGNLINTDVRAPSDKSTDDPLRPAHYCDHPIEPWDFITANDMGFLEGNIIKYVARYKKKGGTEDLKKAKIYLEKLIEIHGGQPS